MMKLCEVSLSKQNNSVPVLLNKQDSVIYIYLCMKLFN